LPERVEAPVVREKALFSPDPAASAPQRPGPAAWSGPSEFTRQLSRGPQLDQEPPEVLGAPSPAEPPAHKPSWVPLLLALNLVVIVATGLILYFALKRC
jgi:hypothetical protein